MMYRRIIMLRKEAHMSQFRLAQVLHISPSAIGMYEQGRRIPSLDILLQMSQLFDVSLDYLVTGTDHTSSALDFDSYGSAEICPCNTCYWKEHNLRYHK